MMTPSTTSITHFLWVATPAIAALILGGFSVLARRRSATETTASLSSKRPAKYVFRHSSVGGSAEGKLILIQRHGETSKNLANPPIRKAVYAKIKAAQEAGLADAVSAEAVQAAVEEWKAHSQDERWFDDCLNREGVEQAAVAGHEIGELLVEHSLFGGNGTVLAVTSPFRRAVQTQAIGWAAAAAAAAAVARGGGGGGGGAVLGLDAEWIALDSLSETPWEQTACKRHDRRDLARWNPLLDVSRVAETTPPSSVVASRGLTEVEGKLQGLSQAEAHRANARAFAEWLVARPEPAVWVTTHQGTVPHLVEALHAVSREPAAFDASSFATLKPKNCQVVALVI